MHIAQKGVFMISFSQILNTLKDDCLSYEIPIDNISITAVRAIEKNTVFKSNTVYVGYVSTVNHIMNVNNTNLVLISDEKLLNEINCNYMILNNLNNIYEIIKNIELMINESEGWSNESMNLFSIFLSDNNIDILCQKCSQYINNPIIITDTSYNIISYSNPHDIKDDVWKSGCKRGNLTYEFVSLLTGENSNYFETDGTRLSYIADNISEHRRKISKCHMNNAFIGYIIILEYYHPFNDEYNSKEELIISLISKEISLMGISITSSYKQQELNLISDLLHNKVTSKIILNTRLESTFLKEFNYYQIISINISNYAFNNSRQGELKNELDLLNNVLILVFEQNIVIVNLLKKRFNRNTDAIIEILNKYGLTAGASNIFADLYNLHNYYLQSLNALNFNALIIQKGPIYNYQDISFYNLLSNIRYNDLDSYCSQNILDIYQDDIKNHTNNLDTLYNYLRFGKNVSKCAKHMFLHRNTINYRINSIVDNYDLNIDDSDSLFTYFISASIIRYKNCSNNFNQK